MTSNSTTETLHDILTAALAAADPYQAVLNTLIYEAGNLHCNASTYALADYDRILVIGFGKAGAPMAKAVFDLLGDRISAGLVIVKYGHTLEPDTPLGAIELVEAGHPVPDDAGLRHTARLIDLLRQTTARDLVITLVSGGGSALLTQPVEGVTLSDLQVLNRVLLAAGADIVEINTIRKHLSQVKGGQLAGLASPATILSLILSDVIGDPLDMIASGPTSPDPTTFTQALDILALARYKLTTQLPTAITDYLTAGANGRHPETVKPADPCLLTVTHHIIGSNQMALWAAMTAAAKAGYSASFYPNPLLGDVRDAAQTIVAAIDHQEEIVNSPWALFFGGETTVTMDQASSGLGGRNQELALLLASRIAGRAGLLIACFATDGNDGPTDAAGAIVDGLTIDRAMANNLLPGDFLAQHNSYHFFAGLNDLIITGPTNTNVNDLVVVLRW